ncbi:hypothetical protein GLA29479_4612 [Lysobacter antibioticus]|uniref:Secreted protein n=1 Tax=Lysobacter antibioticus TaxID=84531 RepID=A0A0S2E3R9_LYSAN|nr:DUF6289 family protein [Lysobacter antibioticus]ALN65443.1 hypothetical protein GLA29479_4612 [Lysobacter antibioticus]ALN82224.1 hypothetical protein LA76x_4108 [Lysobacter antibioticus]
MRLIAIAVATVVLGGFALAGSVKAAPPWQGYSILYFNEAGEEVGGAVASCGGQYSSWGERTAIFQKQTWFCD